MIRIISQTPLPIMMTVGVLLGGLHWAGVTVKDRLVRDLRIHVKASVTDQDDTSGEDWAETVSSEKPSTASAADCPRRLARSASKLTHLEEVIETMRCLNRQDEFQKTLTLGTKWTRQAKSSRNFWLLVGRARDGLGQPEAAKAAYKTVLKLHPESFEATLRLGSLFMKQGHITEATKQFEAARRRAGGARRAKAHVLLGLALARQNRFRDAEKSFLEALYLTPGRVRPRLRLAHLYGKSLGLQDKAEAMLEEATRLAPNDVHVHLAWSEYHERIGNTDAALVASQRAIDLQPENEKARYALAVQQISAERWDAVERHLKWLTENGRRHGPQVEFQWGRLASAQNKPEAAVLHYQAAFDQSGGTYLEALNNLALAAKATGDFERAVKALQMALERNPEYLTARSNLGLLRLQQGDFDRAIAHFQEITKSEPRLFDAWYHWGLAAGRKERFEEAIRAYRRALEIQPSHVKSRLNLGVALRRSGQLQGAIDQYEALLQMQPQYAPAWFNLGLAYKEGKNHSKAEHSLRQAIRWEPQSARYRSALGKLYVSLERPEDAVMLFEEAVLSYPSDVQLRFELASAQWKAKKAEHALDHLQRVVTLDPTLVAAWLLKARIEAATGKLTRAVSTLDKAAKTLPKNAAILRRQGVLSNRKKDFEGAISAYRASLRLEPDHAPTLERLGKLLWEEQKREASLKIWKKLAQLKPRDFEHAYRLGKALYKARRYQEATVHLSNAATHLADRPWADIWLGRAYEKLHSTRQARLSYQRARNKDPQFAPAYVSLGDLDAARGDKAKALALYRKAFELNPNYEPAKKRLSKGPKKRPS